MAQDVPEGIFLWIKFYSANQLARIKKKEYDKFLHQYREIT